MKHQTEAPFNLLCLQDLLCVFSMELLAALPITACTVHCPEKLAKAGSFLGKRSIST